MCFSFSLPLKPRPTCLGSAPFRATTSFCFGADRNRKGRGGGFLDAKGERVALAKMEKIRESGD